MAIQQNLYQVYKIPASFLVAHNCKIENYTIKQGFKDQNIVSIGDNIVFQQLRYLHNDFRNYKDIYSEVMKFRTNARRYHKAGKHIEGKILERQITNILFVEDIINVYVDKKKSDFDKFRTKGFDFNGKHFVFCCAGAGQVRRNTATFINEKYATQVIKNINCGLDEKTTEFCLAKYTTYFALAFSSILWVRTPRVCVIKDYKKDIKNVPIDFVYKDENDKLQLKTIEKDLEMNVFDGQGLIDPMFAILWGEDMNLAYTPCSFVVRSCFIKGNLATFDFKQYAHERGINTIRDRWGQEYNIDDIDVLLSESQFKTYRYYSSWQEFVKYMEKGKIHWGVARYNKRVDEEQVLANYQYIQTLSLTKDDIEQLIQPTIDWIKQICTGEMLPTLLYSFGVKNVPSYERMYNSAQTNALKAVIKNSSYLQDSFIQRKIYKNIIETINRAKLGKIWVRGNYQFMISDPIAQCQFALGLDPKGELRANEMYSNFWRERNVDKVDVCRSPQIDSHEHNPVKIINNNEEANKWYKYLTSGIIFNTYDTSTFRASDADFDGDIVLSTDNEFFIKGSHKEQNIVTYEKGGGDVKKITLSNMTACILKGFGTAVGSISNCATIFYAMAAIFNKPEQKEQHDELLRRVKLLRYEVGQEIDKIKGAEPPKLPAEWKKHEKILSTDTKEERLAKFKRNSMVISKKPYFFRYLYPELNQRFKQFEAAYNQISRDMFNIKFKKLLKKEDKTEEERNLVRKYQKYNPLITSDCTMNRLCRAVENIDFDIKFCKDEQGNKNPNISKLPTFETRFGRRFSLERLEIVKNMYKKYTARKKTKIFEDIMGTATDLAGYEEMRVNIADELISELQSTLTSNKMDGDEFLFYCYRLAPEYTQFNWGFAWDVLDEEILEYIPDGKSFCPVPDENGTEYLGRRYTLVDVTKTDDVLIQNLCDALFGDPTERISEEEILEIKMRQIEQIQEDRKTGGESR